MLVSHSGRGLVPPTAGFELNDALCGKAVEPLKFLWRRLFRPENSDGLYRSGILPEESVALPEAVCRRATIRPRKTNAGAARVLIGRSGPFGQIILIISSEIRRIQLKQDSGCVFLCIQWPKYALQRKFEKLQNAPGFLAVDLIGPILLHSPRFWRFSDCSYPFCSVES